jgi:hypothetical protein
MYKFLLFFIIVSLPLTLSAQDFDFGKFDSQELQMTKYDKDTSAHAVVLHEFGKTWISSADNVPLIHEYHVKIKIFDSKAFDYGDVVISLYHGDNDTYETVRDIKACTFYTDDNGGAQKAELDPKKIFSEKYSKHMEHVKFALPNLHKGCVIEYAYVTESPYPHNFHNWVFQWGIPKIYSEYETHVPAIYDYNIVMRGGLKLTTNTAELEKECFTYYGIKADCTKSRYTMRDIPAFVEEADMTAPANFVSAIYYEMSAMTNGAGVKQKYSKEWKDVDYELKHNEDFGSQIKRKDILKDRIPPAIFSSSDTLAKAQAIYAYLQKTIKWNHDYGIFCYDGIKKALDGHTGSAADINISLIAALNAAGINADAIILSTRDNGVVNRLFPVITEFDYVIAGVNIGNKYYMLDATEPLLAFGMLPLRCINDQGRVMSLNKPSYWIDMVQPQRSTITSTLDLTLQNDGKIKGTITTFYIGYAAFEKRVQIKKFNTTEEYVENLNEKNHRLKILSSDIANLDSLSKPLTEKYDVVIDGYSTLDKENITFDPAFWDQMTENPFKLTERSYPVDLGNSIIHRLVLSFHFPDNFIISKQPEPVGMALPNKGGSFQTNFEVANNLLNYSQVQILTKAIYSPEEYPYLKELFNKIIQNQKATVVLKKKP